MVFQNRTEAGQRLAARMTKYRDESNLLVLGLPRGGVVVAAEVATVLHAPLDVFLVRKLGVPGQEELAMGAIASGRVLVKNLSVIKAADIPARVFEAVVAREWKELRRRERVYRGYRARSAIDGRAVIVVDDGLATGATMRAAIKGLRRQLPARIIVAVPVGAVRTCDKLRRRVDDLVCLKKPVTFCGVGQWYGDFCETSDEEVRRLLEEANRRLGTIARG